MSRIRPNRLRVSRAASSTVKAALTTASGNGSEPEAWISLNLIAGLGGEGTRRLLQQFGSPGAILTRTPAQLEPWVGPKIAAAISKGAPEVACDGVGQDRDAVTRIGVDGVGGGAALGHQHVEEQRKLG